MLYVCGSWLTHTFDQKPLFNNGAQIVSIKRIDAVGANSGTICDRASERGYQSDKEEKCQTAKEEICHPKHIFTLHYLVVCSAILCILCLFQHAESDVSTKKHTRRRSEENAKGEVGVSILELGGGW